METHASDEMNLRTQSQMESVLSTVSLMHGQIASLADRIDNRDNPQPTPPTAPPVVSHRGIGAIAPAPSLPASSCHITGDPVTKYEDGKGEWSANLLNTMREERNCGMSSNIYANFVDEIELTESAQSSIIIDVASDPMPRLRSPAPPDDYAAQHPTAEMAAAAPMWQPATKPAEPAHSPAAPAIEEVEGHVGKREGSRQLQQPVAMAEAPGPATKA